MACNKTVTIPINQDCLSLESRLPAGVMLVWLDLDLDPITLILNDDLDITKMYK